MDDERMENLLREFGATLSDERMFDESRAGGVRERLKSGPSITVGSDIAPGSRTRVLPWGRSHYVRTLTAAAIALAFFGLFCQPPAARLPSAQVAPQVDWALDPSDLFRRQRGGASRADGPVYVGVRTTHAVFVRLIAVCEPAGVEALALGPTGEQTVLINPGGRMAFGGYARTFESAGGKFTRKDILVIASSRPLDPVAVEGVLKELEQRRDLFLAQAAAAAFQARFECCVCQVHLTDM